MFIDTWFRGCKVTNTCGIYKCPTLFILDYYFLLAHANIALLLEDVLFLFSRNTLSNYLNCYLYRISTCFGLISNWLFFYPSSYLRQRPFMLLLLALLMWPWVVKISRAHLPSSHWYNFSWDNRLWAVVPSENRTAKI